MAPRTALSGAFLLLSALLACDAALLTDPSQAAGKTYDFIIVGGNIRTSLPSWDQLASSNALT